MAATLAVLSVAAAQAGGVRLSLCEGFEAPRIDLTTVCGVCGVRGVAGHWDLPPNVAQVRRGYENWELYAYQPRTLAQVGEWGQLQWWPGIATGFEQGAWFVRVNADIILSWNFSP